MYSYHGTKLVYVLLVLWFLSSCGAKASSWTDKLIGQEAEKFFTGSVSATPVKEDDAEVVIQTVKDFWKTAQNGDESSINKYISEAPDQFWVEEPEVDPPAVPNKNNAANEPHIVGQGIMGPSWYRDVEFARLKSFINGIHKAKLELLRARIKRLNETEAIVKIDYVQQENKVKGGWINWDLLLYKSETGWRIFMLTSPSELEKYNKSFGLPKQN